MKRNNMFSRLLRLGASGIALGIACLCPPSAYAQEEVTDTAELLVPGDRNMLQIEVVYPREVRNEQSFVIRVLLRNISDDTAFHDIKVAQIGPSNLQIETTSGGAEDNSSGGKSSPEWSIERLAPGESEILAITASASETGRLDACLGIVSYTPAVCIRTRVIEPEIEVVKRAPRRATICQNLLYDYYVKNVGTGRLDSFVLRDDLAEGIETLRGENYLEFEVDGLDEGEVRRFRAEVRPLKTGNFSSRATVIEPSGDKTRSAEVATRVIAPRLAIEIDGPATTYVDRPTTYTVRVTNHGDATAVNTLVTLQHPGVVRLMRVGPWAESDTAAEVKDTAPSFARRKRVDDPVIADATDWDLGNLSPGETREISMTFTADGSETRTHELVAWVQSFCTDSADVLIAQASDRLSTEVLSLPALAIVLVDEQDPVSDTGEVTYTAVITNEGTAADEDVKLRIELPKQLRFAGAVGPTEGEVDGKAVTFEPVRRLEPGQRAVWRIDAEAVGEGDVAMRAEVTSNSMTKPVAAEEPTTLFAAGRDTNRQSR